MPANTARIIAKDNGYFEVWQTPDGKRVRVNTEDRQMSLRSPGARKAFHAAIRERLSARCA